MGYSRRPRFARVCPDCGGEGMNDYGYACNTCDGSGYLRRCRRCHVNDAPISRRTEDEQRRFGGICWECEIAQVRALAAALDVTPDDLRAVAPVETVEAEA